MFLHDETFSLPLEFSSKSSEEIILSLNQKYITLFNHVHLFTLSSCSAVGWVPPQKHVLHISVLTSSWQYIKSLRKAPCRGFNTKSGLREHICREHSNLIKRKCVIAKHIPLSERLPDTRGTVLSPSVVTDSAHPLNAVSGALRAQTG